MNSWKSTSSCNDKQFKVLKLRVVLSFKLKIQVNRTKSEVKVVAKGKSKGLKGD